MRRFKSTNGFYLMLLPNQFVSVNKQMKNIAKKDTKTLTKILETIRRGKNVHFNDIPMNLMIIIIVVVKLTKINKLCYIQNLFK